MTGVLPPPAAGAETTSSVADALAALRVGIPVLVVDDADREDECDVVLPAALAEPAWVAWAVRHTSGLLCAPMESTRADALNLPPMVEDNRDRHGTAYTVSVDAATDVTTGISAADRARTARVLADPDARAQDLRRPGHVLPLRAEHGGIVQRRGHTEAAVDLCRMAGLAPVGLIAELVTDDGPDAGRTARRTEVADMAHHHSLPVLNVAELVRYRYFHGDGLRERVTRSARSALPTRHGAFDALGFRDEVTGAEHLAVTVPVGGGLPTVAVHIECPIGDVFGSRACRCRQDLEQSLAAVADDGGALVYVRSTRSIPTGCTAFSTEAEAGAAAAVLADLDLTDIALCRESRVDARQLEYGGIRTVER